MDDEWREEVCETCGREVERLWVYVLKARGGKGGGWRHIWRPTSLTTICLCTEETVGS